MIVSITTWLIVVLDVLVTLSVTALIGKPQKPLTEGTAAWSVVILAVFGILLFLSWEQVHTAPVQVDPGGGRGVPGGGVHAHCPADGHHPEPPYRSVRRLGHRVQRGGGLRPALRLDAPLTGSAR